MSRVYSLISLKGGFVLLVLYKVIQSHPKALEKSPGKPGLLEVYF